MKKDVKCSTASLQERFLLVKTVERDTELRVYPALDIAQRAMYKQLKSELKKEYGKDWKEEFESDTGEAWPNSPEEVGEIEGDEIGLTSGSAYMTAGENIDWTIYVLPGTLTDGEVPCVSGM